MDPSAEIAAVQIDGQVVLKMISHARQNYPAEITGVLLGLDLKNRLEITNSFPHYLSNDEDANDEHQEQMHNALRKVNADYNTVGWYVSCPRSRFWSQEMIGAHYSYQSALPSSVCLMIEPYRPGSNQLGIKAYRLTEAFMKVYASQDFSHASFADNGAFAEDILEEVPILVHNSHLAHAFLYELRESKQMSTQHDRLHINVNQFVEKTVGSISKCIDSYASEQSTLLYHERALARQKTQQAQWLQKRAAENELRAKQGLPPLPDDRHKQACFKHPAKAPQKLDSYLLTNRMNLHAGEVLADTAQGLNKLYVVEALNNIND